MEKEKQTAKPQETEMPRPELIHQIWELQIGGVAYKSAVSDGLWLRKGSGRVLVREGTDPWPQVRANQIGSYKLGETAPGPGIGPAYTGPIDDELMANILIYGG